MKVTNFVKVSMLTAALGIACLMPAAAHAQFEVAPDIYDETGMQPFGAAQPVQSAAIPAQPAEFQGQFTLAHNKGSQGTLDQFWLWSMQAGLQNASESIKAFSETDFIEDLEKVDVPTLVMHGEDDQIVPVNDSAKKSARLIKGAKEIYYPGASHGLTATYQGQVNADLLAFLKGAAKAAL